MRTETVVVVVVRKVCVGGVVSERLTMAFKRNACVGQSEKRERERRRKKR